MWWLVLPATLALTSTALAQSGTPPAARTDCPTGAHVAPGGAARAAAPGESPDPAAGPPRLSDESSRPTPQGLAGGSQAPAAGTGRTGDPTGAGPASSASPERLPGSTSDTVAADSATPRRRPGGGMGTESGSPPRC
jgi:hypothetical protein